ncbi:signal peptidase II, partial [Pseudomonas syringae group genomosp. 7]
VVVVGLIIYIQKLKKQDKWFGIALALMLGGAIGNFIDRVVRKEVVDFVNTYIFTYDFPIFNVADSALVVGVIIMFI